MASVTKRGLYQTRDPNPRVVEISKALHESGMTWEQVKDNAHKAGFKITTPTISRFYYVEVYEPRETSIAAILAGLGFTFQWVKPDGTQWQWMAEDQSANYRRGIKRKHK